MRPAPECLLHAVSNPVGAWFNQPLMVRYVLQRLYREWMLEQCTYRRAIVEVGSHAFTLHEHLSSGSQRGASR